MMARDRLQRLQQRIQSGASLSAAEGGYLLKLFYESESRAAMAQNRAMQAEAALAQMRITSSSAPQHRAPPTLGTSVTQLRLQSPKSIMEELDSRINKIAAQKAPESHGGHGGGAAARREGTASAPAARRYPGHRAPQQRGSAPLAPQHLFSTQADEPPQAYEQLLRGADWGAQHQLSPSPPASRRPPPGQPPGRSPVPTRSTRSVSSGHSLGNYRRLDHGQMTGDAAGLRSTGLIFEAHRVYTLADRDRNGTLDMEEIELMRKCLQRVHPELWPHPLTPAFAEGICGGIDTDNSGDVDRGEWVTFITEQARAYGERPMLKLMQVLGKQLDKLWTP